MIIPENIENLAELVKGPEKQSSFSQLVGVEIVILSNLKCQKLKQRIQNLDLLK